eukprot:TRINITY_DN3936_c0_g1_i3.p2 TRINITY_DN3936_c0_g1~~TRINITY_DN3936_c0_g1_i3.p2  ORF type:complete len:188 (-),score=27.26 TRINITY_DN3936_c0_g1_i3:71-634(-)
MCIRDSYQAGCTANVILIRNNNLYIANVGDSRSILAEKSGRVTALSIDHKPEMATEKERVQKAGGFISNGRINGNLNLSRALGDLEYKKNNSKSRGEQLISCIPDIIERNIDNNFEFILMGCDGVFEILSNDSLVEYIRNQLRSTDGDLESAIENLLEQILAPNTSQGVGCDNMSAIIIKFASNSDK